MSASVGHVTTGVSFWTVMSREIVDRWYCVSPSNTAENAFGYVPGAPKFAGASQDTMPFASVTSVVVVPPEDNVSGLPMIAWPLTSISTTPTKNDVVPLSMTTGMLTA